MYRDGEKYIIAVKRDHRKTISGDWKEKIEKTRGVQVDAKQGELLFVHASRDAIERIHASYDNCLNIEKQILHS